MPISSGIATGLVSGLLASRPTTPFLGEVWVASDTNHWYLSLTAGSWTDMGASGAAPGGSTTQLQYNNAGAFGGITGATTDGTVVTLTSPIITAASAGISITIGGTQPTTTGSGTGTNAGSSLTLTGAAGGNTSDTTANTRGGIGSGITFTGGAGGQQTGASSGTARGGAGGTFNFISGAGGAATAVTGTVPGGAGGALNYTGGAGGTSATSTGGQGGGQSFLGGAGGISTAAAVSGAGGALSFIAGAGGANSNAAGTAGNGAALNLDAGAKGANTGGAAAGANGNITIGNTNATAVTIGSLTGPVSIFGDRSAGNAAAGQVGEIISSLVAVGSPVALTTATAANVTTLSLTAGDWDVEGNINLSATTATITASQGGISIVSATVPTDGSEVYSGVVTTALSEINSIVLPRHRVVVSSTTTTYMVVKLTFSAGSVGAFGSFTARRVR